MDKIIVINYYSKKYKLPYIDDNEFIGNIVYHWRKSKNIDGHFRMFTRDKEIVCSNAIVKRCKNQEIFIQDILINVDEECLEKLIKNLNISYNETNFLNFIPRIKEYKNYEIEVKYCEEFNFHELRNIILNCLVSKKCSFSVKKNVKMVLKNNKKIYKTRINTLVNIKKNIIIFTYEKNIESSISKAIIAYSKNFNKTIWFININKAYFQIGKIYNNHIDIDDFISLYYLKKAFNTI